MQNDVLKNSIAPWQEKGRWYHAHMTEAGLDSLNTDDYLVNNSSTSVSSSSFIIIDKKANIIDYKIKINSFAATAVRTYTWQIGFRTTGEQHFVIPVPNTFDKIDMDVYVFIE